MSLMKKNSWKLILLKGKNNIVVDSFATKEDAEEELTYRNSLCVALGYTPDIPYKIQKINN